jgi:ABC-type antimicrobial peptide transport system permease subunit
LLFYRPLQRVTDQRARALFVRVAPGGQQMEAVVARALQEMEPGLPFVRVQWLGAALDPQIRPWRLGAAVFTALGALAFVIASFGLYGALAYAVAQRTREIGLRVAVGARRSDIVRLLANDGLAIALTGALIGVAISLVGGRWIADLLFNVSPRDPAALVVASGSLVSSALLAALVSSRRATRVDPTVALRAE